MKTSHAKTDTKNTPMSHEGVSLGLSREDRTASVQLLNRALANASILVIKTKKCHWDIVGPQFMTLHKLFDEHYNSLATFVDEAAERIRMLGGYPVGTAQGYLALTDLKEEPGAVPSASAAVRLLKDDHETIARQLREFAGDTSETDDLGTTDFLTRALQDHEKIAWMLRAFLEGEAVQPNGRVEHSVPALA